MWTFETDTRSSRNGDTIVSRIGLKRSNPKFFETTMVRPIFYISALMVLACVNVSWRTGQRLSLCVSMLLTLVMYMQYLSTIVPNTQLTVLYESINRMFQLGVFCVFYVIAFSKLYELVDEFQSVKSDLDESFESFVKVLRKTQTPTIDISYESGENTPLISDRIEAKYGELILYYIFWPRSIINAKNRTICKSPYIKFSIMTLEMFIDAWLVFALFVLFV